MLRLTGEKILTDPNLFSKVAGIKYYRDFQEDTYGRAYF